MSIFPNSLGLTPDEFDAAFAKLVAQFLQTNKSRYEELANQLIEVKSLEIETDSVKIAFNIKFQSFTAQLAEKENLRVFEESVCKIGFSKQSKREELPYLFANAEASAHFHAQGL